MKRACVIGWPVEHSRSPIIHRYWLKLYGIDGAYEKEAVQPEQARVSYGRLASAATPAPMSRCRTNSPRWMRRTSQIDAARAIGAANTLWLDSAGRLHATNTDAYGFMTNLDEQASDWKGGRRPVAVLGAGGAARAVLRGLIEAGASKILLANRSPARAEALAAAFGPRSKWWIGGNAPPRWQVAGCS